MLMKIIVSMPEKNASHGLISISQTVAPVPAAPVVLCASVSFIFFAGVLFYVEFMWSLSPSAWREIESNDHRQHDRALEEANVSRRDNHTGLLCWKTEEPEKKLFSTFSCKVCCAEDWNAWIDGREAGCERERRHPDKSQHATSSAKKRAAIS